MVNICSNAIACAPQELIKVDPVQPAKRRRCPAWDGGLPRHIDHAEISSFTQSRRQVLETVGWVFQGTWNMGDIAYATIPHLFGPANGHTGGSGPHSRPLQSPRGSSFVPFLLQALCASLIWGHPGSAMRLAFAGIRLRLPDRLSEAGDDDAATETAHRQATVVSLRARSAGRQVREYLSAFGISWVPAPKKAEERPDKWSSTCSSESSGSA